MNYPVIIQLGLETRCNLDCWFCLYKHRDDLPHAEFKIENIDKIGKVISKAKTISISAYGEPLISKNFPALLEKVYHYNNRKELISMVTNGQAITPDIVKLLSGRLAGLTISVNYSDSWDYRRDMKGDFHKLFDNIRVLKNNLSADDWRKVNFHMVAHKGNYSQIPPFIMLATMFGVPSVRVDQVMIAGKDDMPQSLINCREQYEATIERAISEAKSFGVNFTARRFNEKGNHPCRSPWDECLVWVDGSVSPCCYNGSYIIGNVFETSFEDVWFGKAYEELRKHGIPQCKTCPKVLPLSNPDAHIYPLLREKLK